MSREDLLELIHLQIVNVQEQVGSQTSRGEKTDRTMGLLRSLRRTLRVLSSGDDPEDEAASSFLLSVSREGRVFLRRDGHLGTLRGPFFRSLFQLAGISLQPGQYLLIEPEFARRAIEDSLGETLAEEYRLEQRRAELKRLLRESVAHERDRLLVALGRLDEQEADLLIAKVELAELKVAADRS